MIPLLDCTTNSRNYIFFVLRAIFDAREFDFLLEPIESQ